MEETYTMIFTAVLICKIIHNCFTVSCIVTVLMCFVINDVVLITERYNMHGLQQLGVVLLFGRSRVDVTIIQSFVRSQSDNHAI